MGKVYDLEEGGRKDKGISELGKGAGWRLAHYAPGYYKSHVELREGEKR